MPLIRSLASVCHVLLAISISLNGKIMSPCSYYAKKGLVCVTIIAPFSRQPFLYIECTKLNICLSCNIKLVSDAKCLYFMRLCSLQSLRLFYLSCPKVLYSNIHCET